MSFELSTVTTTEGDRFTDGPKASATSHTSVNLSALPVTLWASQEMLDRQMSGTAWVLGALSEEEEEGASHERQQQQQQHPAGSSSGAMSSGSSNSSNVNIEVNIPHVCLIALVEPAAADGTGKMGRTGASLDASAFVVVDLISVTSGKPDERLPSWSTTRMHRSASPSPLLR